jgi:hypothetical protein
MRFWMPRYWKTAPRGMLTKWNQSLESHCSALLRHPWEDQPWPLCSICFTPLAHNTMFTLKICISFTSDWLFGLWEKKAPLSDPFWEQITWDNSLGLGAITYLLVVLKSARPSAHKVLKLWLRINQCSEWVVGSSIQTAQIWLGFPLKEC